MSVDLVLIGHVGFATDRTPNGTVTYSGGSGFAAAFAAAALHGGRVGLTTKVGEDFDLAILHSLGLNVEGIAVQPGVSARFVIDQFSDGGLSFRSDLGVAAEPGLDLFPASYFQARYVHLGTAPPWQQLAWLDFLRDQGCRAQISADMFEPFVVAEPDCCWCSRSDQGSAAVRRLANAARTCRR